jgi:c(7)-type cytochrome triheme protein
MSKSTFSTFILFLTLSLFPAVASAVPDGVNLTWPGGGAGKVTFDGTLHAKKGYQCDACHIAGLFQTKKNADVMTMDAMKQGKFCGVCHNGKKAFSTTDPKKCSLCHKAEKKETEEKKKDVQQDSKKKKKLR